MKKILQAILCLSLLLYSCKEELPDKLYMTSEQMQISSYLENRPDMTMTTELVKRSGYFNLLNSYGRYTVFAPTDNAWKNYLESLGKSGISGLTEEECATLFDPHVLLSNVNLKAQRTGLLSYMDTTMSGIRHFVDLTGGFNNIVMNKTSKVEGYSELPNGFVYTMSEVFEPRPANIYDYLQKEGYSIFAEAIETIGMKDTLQSLEMVYPGTKYLYTPYYTLFAESDAVYQKAGITNLEQLTDAVWNREQAFYATPDEALKAFVQYHILWNLGTNQKLTTSLYKMTNLRTSADNRSKVIGVAASDPMKPDPLLNGAVKMNLHKSDVSFKNGIVHELADILNINRTPQLCEYIFECEDTYVSVPVYIDDRNSDNDVYKYLFYDASYDTKRCLFPRRISNTSFSSSYYDDVNIGTAYYAIPTERGFWIDFYIRNLPAGKYDVYLNYRRVKAVTSQKVNVYFRSAGEEYDWKTQKLYQNSLDMAYDNSSAEDDRMSRYPEFNQNVLLGRICNKVKTTDNEGKEVVEETPLDYGDYVFRFVHADNRVAFYDNIILKPVQ